MKVVVVVSALAMVVGTSSMAQGVTRTAASCNMSDVAAAVNASADGDTVVLPPGTCTWTGTLTLTKGVTVSGGGRYAVDGSQNDIGTWPVLLNTGTITPFAINVPVGAKVPRITGISFLGNPVFEYNWFDGPGALFIHAFITNQASYRIDNNKFHTLGADGGVIVNSDGLIDHNYFIADQIEGHMVMVQHPGASGNGDEQWAKPTGFGGPGFTFLEDNTFVRPRGAVIFQSSVVDSYAGGKYVFRHNYVKNGWILNHDKSGGGWSRAGVAFEVYANTFTFDDPVSFQTAMYLRDGTMLYYNNVHLGYFQSYIKFWNRRTEEAQSNWGLCDGSHPWDGNVQRGYPCLDQVGRGPSGFPSPNSLQPQPRVPVRIWGNTGPVFDGCAGTPEQNGKICNPNPTTIVAGVDYLFSDDNSAALPGYTGYTYPHPLTTGSSVPPAAPTAPNNLRVVSK